MSEGTRARGRLMPAPFAMPRSGLALLCGARPLCVPVGGGPPARSPHASLRLGVVDLEARPGPAATHRHRGQAPPPPINFARNSPAACSNIEFASLELQRFWGVSKDDRDKLGATFGWRWCRRRPRAPKSGPASALTHIAAVLLNIACNSPTTLSNYEFTTSELQRFQTLLKFRPIELHANLLRSGHVAARGCRGSFA